MTRSIFLLIIWITTSPVPLSAQGYEDCIPPARMVREPFKWPLGKAGIDSVTYVPLKVPGPRPSIVLEHYIMVFEEPKQNVKYLSYLIKSGEVSNVSSYGKFPEIKDRYASYKICGDHCLIYLRYHWGGKGPVEGTPLPLNPAYRTNDPYRN